MSITKWREYTLTLNHKNVKRWKLKDGFFCVSSKYSRVSSSDCQYCKRHEKITSKPSTLLRQTNNAFIGQLNDEDLNWLLIQPSRYKNKNKNERKNSTCFVLP